MESLGRPLTFPINPVSAAVDTDVIASQVSGDTANRFVLNADGSMEWGPGNAAADITLRRGSSGALWQSSLAIPQLLRIYNTTDSDTVPVNYERGVIGWNGNKFFVLTQNAGTGTPRNVSMGCAGAASIFFQTTNTDRWQVDPNGLLLAVTDNAVDIGATAATRPRSIFLASPAITPGSGTGYTLNDSGSVRKLTLKCTLTFAGLAAAALTADKIIATLPAKARITAIYADVTTKFLGGAVSAATMKIGSTVGGAEVLASFDCFTAAVTKGLADADLGTSLVRAAAIQGGFMPSFVGTTGLNLRITTVTANTNALTQGSVTIYIEAEVLQ